jgi:hypothetical protein
MEVLSNIFLAGIWLVVCTIETHELKKEINDGMNCRIAEEK